ncbi:LamG domain-containing protein [Candidatus Poribacteria bacterium]|nr:LamG domain-containing protein [Candidatus Poribacteria bacterium]
MIYRIICVLCCLTLGFNVGYAALNEDLVGLWLFDEGKGDTVKDSSGMGNDGKAEGGPKWVDGKYGGGMEFDGVDDMVVIPDSDVLEFDDDFTLAVWIKTEAKPPEPPAIITKGYHDRSNTRPWYLLYYRPTGTITMYLRNLANQNSIADGKTPVNDGKWHHVIGMKVGDKVKVYIDGKEDASAPLSGKAKYGGNDYPLVFMRHYDRFLSGIIDEVAIFKRALTEDEIQQLMEGAGTLLAVDPNGKLATSWGAIKENR